MASPTDEQRREGMGLEQWRKRHGRMVDATSQSLHCPLCCVCCVRGGGDDARRRVFVLRVWRFHRPSSPPHGVIVQTDRRPSARPRLPLFLRMCRTDS